MSSHPVRVRFSPAPSGWLHVGGARTALFNWLWARQQGGVMVLRIEDTDAERATIELAHGMMDALTWLGLTWDEGIGVDDAPYGPYLQSERRPLHDAVARRLVAAGYAYEAFETPEELDAAREALQAAKQNPAYKTGHRDLTDDQKAAYRAQGREPVLRIRTPDEGTVSFDDLVRGTVTFDWKDIGDFVICRADGSPTYLLANVVDDLSQGISLIARGEDLLSATPRQLLMQDLLMRPDADGTPILDAALAEVGYTPREGNWSTAPDYAHLPLLVGADRKKLSKRHGDVAIDQYRKNGFLPEVMLNFLAICGWSADGSTEHFTVDELIKAFSFDRVSPNPSFFDDVKLRNFNGDAIKAMPVDVFANHLVDAFVQAEVITEPVQDTDRALITAFAPLLQERSQTLADAVPMVAFAFRDEVVWDEAAIKKWMKPVAGQVLDFITPRLKALTEWTPDAIHAVFDEAKASLDLGMGKIMQPARVAVTGTAVSPPLPETLSVLDQTTVVDRLLAGRSKVLSE
ncbi:glutamate--tRNA ligase [Stomatohabitans albus]|uniref:glutamate--tRNA ligase n=1 Tax=Stomatohabitans albus TaxID=3110766 RepID=UPI00300DA331